MPKTKKTTNIVHQVKKEAKTKKQKDVMPDLFVPSGSTLLNLALSDDPFGGWACGSIHNLCGESSSGKTFESRTLLACAASDPRFDGYLLINDDAENRDNFDDEYLFGAEVASRIEPPHGFDEDDMPINSSTIEEFQDRIHELLDKEIPFVYVLDSFDALDSVADQKKYEEQRDAREKGKDTSGTYQMAKQKEASALFRRIRKRMRKTKSCLIVISQTRDNISGMGGKTRSGGNALKFYSCSESWMKPTKNGTIKSKDTPIGIISQCQFTKNSITGKRRNVLITIYYDYGLDDIGANIDYLLKMKEIKVNGSKLTAPTFVDDEMVTMSKSKYIRFIENNNLEEELAELVGEVWTEFENSLRSGRKRRFG